MPMHIGYNRVKSSYFIRLLLLISLLASVLYLSANHNLLPTLRYFHRDILIARGSCGDGPA